MATTVQVIATRATLEITATPIPSSGVGGGSIGADLTAIEALTGTGWAERTGDGVWTLSTPTYTDVGADAAGSASTVASVAAAALAAHVAAADPHVGYLLETDAATLYQPLDGDLTALAALSSTGIARRTGSSTWSVGTTVSVAEGGTGATTASAARTALGVVIGTDVQAWDADLDALAALSTTGWARRTGAGAWTLDTPSSTGLSLIAAADAAAVRSLAGLTDARYQEQLYVSNAAFATTSITLSDVSGVTFTPEASAVYLVELYIAYDSGSTTVGLGVGIDPGSADMGSLFMIGRGGASSSGTAYYGSVLATTPQITTPTALAGGTANPVAAWSVIRTTSSPTAIKLQCGAEVGGTEVRIAAGMAVLRVRRLA